MQNFISEKVLNNILDIKKLVTMEKVGRDDERRDYYYIGKGLFIREGVQEKNEEIFDIMELPVTKEINGNVARIEVTPSLDLINFYIPGSYGYDTVIERAFRNGEEWIVEHNFSLLCQKLNEALLSKNENYATRIFRMLGQIELIERNKKKSGSSIKNS